MATATLPHHLNNQESELTLSLVKTSAKRPYIRASAAEIYSEETMQDRLVVARERVIRAFTTFEAPCRGKMRRTESYIIGVGRRHKELASYVNREMGKRRISSPDDIRAAYPHLTPKQIERTIQLVDHELILMAVDMMASSQVYPACEIWYDEHGCWNVLQSVLDQYHARSREVQTKYFNRRNEHGMVRSQRKRRGRPAGASVSFRDARMVI